MALDSSGRVVPDAPSSGFRIDSQQETTEVDQRGRAMDGIRVFFTTARGNQGSVFLARSLYTVTNARAAVAAQAAVMDQVHQLTG